MRQRLLSVFVVALVGFMFFAVPAALRAQTPQGESAPLGQVLDTAETEYQRQSAAAEAARQKSIAIEQATDDLRGFAGDRTLSPFFVALGQDPKTDRLALKKTRADVRIAGMMAEVNITQIYGNEGENPLEAVYLFPTSTLAAVHAMKMTVGGRVVRAQINKRAEARQKYETAKASGRTASLLEQMRPNIFQMNLANILPGDEIKVEISYTELLVPEEGIYQFVFPTVVGPRYSHKPAAGAAESDKWVAQPTQRRGEAALFPFGLDLDLVSPVPIGEVENPSHNLSPVFHGSKNIQLTLPESADAGNRDFVFRYSLSGKQVESGLMLYPGEKENFFLLMVQPPERVAARQVIPREYIVAMDISGSMDGYPLDLSKELLVKLVGDLRPYDFFNVVAFSNESYLLSESSLPATPENLERAKQWVEQQKGGGGTEILPALETALAIPRLDKTSRILVLATDGYVDVEQEAFSILRRDRQNAAASGVPPINAFVFGIGRAPNRYLAEGMGKVGGGESFWVADSDKAPQVLDRFQQYVSSPILQGVTIQFAGLDVYDAEPLFLHDLFAQRPIVVFGKYRDLNLAGGPEKKVIVQGNRAGEAYWQEIPFKQAEASADNQALAYLWARHRIARLDDYDYSGNREGAVEEVTGLGLQYHLMTKYTSFVAVDEPIRTDPGRTVTVQQPLPLPQGVPDSAVGAVDLAVDPLYLSNINQDAIEEIEVIDTGADVSFGGAVGGFGKILQRRVPVCDLDVDESAMVAVGALSKDTIVETLKKEDTRWDSCLKKAFDRKDAKDKRFQVRIKITVNSKGKVMAAEVVQQLHGDPILEACLLKKALKFRFPESRGVSIFVMPLSVTK